MCCDVTLDLHYWVYECHTRAPKTCPTVVVSVCHPWVSILRFPGAASSTEGAPHVQRHWHQCSRWVWGCLSPAINRKRSHTSPADDFKAFSALPKSTIFFSLHSVCIDRFVGQYSVAKKHNKCQVLVRLSESLIVILFGYTETQCERIDCKEAVTTHCSPKPRDPAWMTLSFRELIGHQVVLSYMFISGAMFTGWLPIFQKIASGHQAALWDKRIHL